jgi:Gram-negative bacterial TonB protein C-terminal
LQDIIEKVIAEKYFGVITDNKDSIENLLKIYAAELESGYSSVQKFTEQKKSDAKSAEWKSVFTYIEAYAPNTKFSAKSEKTVNSAFEIISQPGTKLPDTGVVRLRVLFLSNGKVGAVVPSDFKSKKMNAAATIVAKLITFKPLIKNGQPVSIWKTVEYRFTIY